MCKNQETRMEQNKIIALVHFNSGWPNLAFACCLASSMFLYNHEYQQIGTLSQKLHVLLNLNFLWTVQVTVVLLISSFEKIICTKFLNKKIGWKCL